VIAEGASRSPALRPESPAAGARCSPPTPADRPEWGRGGSAPNLTVVGEDPRIIEYRETYETLVEDALSEEESIVLMRQVAGEMAP
jgi:hypothetical protein